MYQCFAETQTTWFWVAFFFFCYTKKDNSLSWLTTLENTFLLFAIWTTEFQEKYNHCVSDMAHSRSNMFIRFWECYVLTHNMHFNCGKWCFLRFVSIQKCVFQFFFFLFCLGSKDTKITTADNSAFCIIASCRVVL